MPESWTRAEVEALVADYFSMLNEELQGQPYNKTAHRAALAPLLQNRSAPSIEFKHANVSAILIELSFPFIPGYKPRSNYQRLLRDVVEDRLVASPGLIQLAAADLEAVPVPTFDDILAALTAPPRPTQVRERRDTPDAVSRRPSPLNLNYLELEASNRRLGRAGEEFVLTFERARLTRDGAEPLAARVEHVAHTRGDGLGYDILSFDATGAERLIEVKTTKYGAEAPFYVSRNELSVSKEMAPLYHLYRVYDFRRKARLFSLGGSLAASCSLEPDSYIARVA